MSDQDGNDGDDAGETWDERTHSQNDGVEISHKTDGVLQSQQKDEIYYCGVLHGGGEEKEENSDEILNGYGGGNFLNGWNDDVKMKCGDFHGGDVVAKVNDDAGEILHEKDSGELLDDGEFLIQKNVLDCCKIHDGNVMEKGNDCGNLNEESYCVVMG